MAFIAYDPGSLASQSRKRLRSLQKYGLPTAQEYQRISEQIAPQENALALQQYQQYAPLLQQLGLQLQSQQQQGGLRNDLAALQGPGQDLVANAQALDQMVNPQWYNQRDITNQGYSALIGGMNPNKLSGSELAETERGLNRMNTQRGNINVTDATTTAANAGAFGSQLAAKQQRFGQALSLFPSISGASRSPLDTFGIATGRNNMNNPLGVGNVSTGTQSLGQGIDQQLGQMYGINQGIRAGAQTGNKAVNESFTAAGQAAGGCACYIFKEHYGYPDVPQYLRWVRDYFYHKDPRYGYGYKKMAFWLVPYMRRWTIIRQLVTWGMIFPLAAHARYLTGYNKWGWVLTPFKHFWLKVWKTI